MTVTNETDEQLPDALIDELKRIDQAPAMITSRVDRTLSAMAHAHFLSRQERGGRRRAWGAAAACVLIAVLFTTTRLEEQGNPPMYADMDGSGTIDIADVLALARTGQSVDQGVLDAFAYRLVSLGGNEAP